jgi:hypothetical protein
MADQLNAGTASGLWLIAFAVPGHDDDVVDLPEVGKNGPARAH